MTTPISIVSLNQGKGLYKDWTLETVDDDTSSWHAVIDMLTQVWAMRPQRSAMAGPDAGGGVLVAGE